MNIRYPYMLVCVAEKKKLLDRDGNDVSLVEIDRHLYPLDRGYGRIEFPRPGSFVVHAAIVFYPHRADETGGKAVFNELKEIYLRKNNDGTYMAELTWHDEFDQSSFAWAIGHEEAVVSVAPEFFAKEPPAWLRSWAMKLNEKMPRNQCEWRRRLIFAFTVQPIVWMILAAFLMFITIVRGIIGIAVAALAFCILGYREVNLKPIFHPDSSRIEEILFGGRGILWHWPECFWTRTTSSRKKRHPGVVVLITPWMWISCFLITYGVPVLLGHTTLIFRVATLVVAMGVLAGVVSLIALHLTKMQKDSAEKREQKKKETRALYDAYYQDRLVPLACFSDTAPTNATVGALPKSHRTIVLRFEELKTKVCRPFAR